MSLPFTSLLLLVPRQSVEVLTEKISCSYSHSETVPGLESYLAK